MMRVYFDRANFESFISQRSKDEARFELCNDMLKKQMDVFLNMNMAEFQTSPLCVSWLTTMTSGAKKFPDCNPEVFSFEPITDSDSFVSDLDKEEHSSIFLLDDEKINEVSFGKGVMAGIIGNEIEVLSKLIIDEDTKYISSLTDRHFRATNNWSPLIPYIRPCTDIIIRDAFILLNQRNHRYENNIYSLILKLASELKDSKLNIVIVCLRFNPNEANQIEPGWDDIRLNIKQILKTRNNVDASVTYIIANKKKSIKHDRTIFTNYIRYLPDDSLGNFYDNRGAFSSESDQFHIHSMAKSSLYDDAINFIDKIQSLIYDIYRGNVDGGEIKKDPDYDDLN